MALLITYVSRNKLKLFFTQVPQAEKSPTVIPDSLWQMLVTHRPDWLSKDQKRMLTNSLGKEYQSLPGDALFTNIRLCIIPFRDIYGQGKCICHSNIFTSY